MILISSNPRAIRRTRRVAPLRALRASVQNLHFGSGYAGLGVKGHLWEEIRPSPCRLVDTDA